VRGIKESEIIYIDDRKEFVEQASSMGMSGLVYRSYPQFAYWLREKGLYIN
jgi:hypothetical protein